MKKLVTIVFLLMMSVTLFACGKSDKADEKENEPVLEKSQLIGTWEYIDGSDFQQIIIEETGLYRQITSVSGMKLDHTDSYDITDNRLILYYDEMGIKYTYKVTFDGSDKMNFYNAGNDELVITYTRKAE